MLVKILGGLDILAAALLLLGMGVQPNTKILLFFGIIIMVKSGFGMLKDFASWIDFLSGAVILLMIFIHIPWIISIILAILLLQKGLFSFI